MKIASTAALIMLWAQPAEACHRYHQWYYPTPQRCRVNSSPGLVAPQYVKLTPEPMARPPDLTDPSRSLEPSPSMIVVIPPPALKQEALPPTITEMPESWEDIQRKGAIEKLRSTLHKKGQQ
jgi:hypothetical protein